jgi:hypothetical protein
MNTSIDTLTWLNKQLDELNGKSKLIGEMLLEEDSMELVQILDKKLAEIEQEHTSLFNKLQQEKEIIKKTYDSSDDDPFESTFN